MSPTLQWLIGVLVGLLIIATTGAVVWMKKLRMLQQRFDVYEENSRVRDVAMSMQLEKKTNDYNEMYRKATEYQKLILVAQNERDGWQKLYSHSTLAAGNAQNRMMIERDRNFQLLQTNGIRPFRDQVIDQLIGAYREEFYDAVKKSADSPKDEPPVVSDHTSG
jgi:uncharacterized membrane-anchored protein YhcB (DUF1043 family)